MKIMVTGSEGFIAKNLIVELRNRNYDTIFEVSRETSKENFKKYCEQAEFVFHLAGVNRSQNESEFMQGNYEFLAQMLTTLERSQNNCPILMSSSIQAANDTLYGQSKLAAEECLLQYARRTDARIWIYRLPNVFGKWSRPNYNSVVATFCHNVSRGLEIRVNDPNHELELLYIDDLIEDLIQTLENRETYSCGYRYDFKTCKASVGELAQRIKSFKESRHTLQPPNFSDELAKKLYSTYLSFLPEEDFSYPLKMHRDERGSFSEFIRTPASGQISVNISKPGITKGNHWHHTKVEKFLVVSGKGVIRFRQILSDKVIEYFVDGNKLEVIDIPAGYTHNIENLGEDDLITVMWANECFDKERPDTYFLEV